MNIRCKNMAKAYWRYYKSKTRKKSEEELAIEASIERSHKFISEHKEEFDAIVNLPKHVDENGMVCVGDKTYN